MKKIFFLSAIILGVLSGTQSVFAAVTGKCQCEFIFYGPRCATNATHNEVYDIGTQSRQGINRDIFDFYNECLPLNTVHAEALRSNIPSFAMFDPTDTALLTAGECPLIETGAMLVNVQMFAPPVGTLESGIQLSCGVMAQCGDGLDNDGDGTTDVADPGCGNDSAWLTEVDVPAAPTTVCVCESLSDGTLSVDVTVTSQVACEAVPTISNDPGTSHEFAVCNWTVPPTPLPSAPQGSPTFIPLASIPLVNPLSGPTDVPSFVGGIIQRLLGILGSISLVVFMYGAFKWITSEGESDDIAEGTHTMAYAAIGILVIFASYGILSSVIKGITRGG